jgi:uncharacterized alkaline shock family protein YloU
MSERDQRPRSPLESERGSTTIKDSVVSKVAGLAAGEVEGVYMSGSASRAAGGILGSVTGTQDLSRGVSVEVGRVETAIDLSVEIEYGRNILQLSELVRNRVTERVENLLGLRVTELNVTINDVIFPDWRGGAKSGRSGEDRTRLLQTEEIRTGDGREPGAAGTEPVEATAGERSRVEGERGIERREEPRVAEMPPEEEETAELRIEEEETGHGRER